MSAKEKLTTIYNILLNKFGYQNWWPGNTPFEIIIGAILTQNVSWKNVERAIKNLKKERLLSFRSLMSARENKIAKLIRPTGYYNQKARKLKNILKFILKEYRGSLSKMKGENKYLLRRKLLGVNGIGKETADSIVLYAFDKPIFVVDAYTKRIFSRLGLIGKDYDYDSIQNFFTRNLQQDVSLYNDFHAQIVNLGKDFCKNKKPLCTGCPLKKICKHLLYFVDIH